MGEEEPEEAEEKPKARTRAQVRKEQEKKGKGDADSSSGEDSEPEEDPHNMAASRKAANAQLKKDLEAEQKEMAKVLMTNRQRKLYQQVEKESQVVKDKNKKLKIKRKAIEKKK